MSGGGWHGHTRSKVLEPDTGGARDLAGLFQQGISLPGIKVSQIVRNFQQALANDQRIFGGEIGAHSLNQNLRGVPTEALSRQLPRLRPRLMPRQMGCDERRLREL